MVQAECPHKIFAEKKTEILEATRDRQGTLQVPQKRIGKTEILNHDPVVSGRNVDGGSNARPRTGIDFAVRFKRAGQKEIAVPGKLGSQRRAKVRQRSMNVTATQEDFG